MTTKNRSWTVKAKSLVWFLVITTFILTQIYPIDASVISINYASSTGTIRNQPIKLGEGIAGQSLVSATEDYATVSVSSGTSFNVNTNIASIAPTMPSIDVSNKASFNNANQGSLTLSTTTANELLYLTIHIDGTNTVDSVSNTGTALTWTQRERITNSIVSTEIWYAYSTVQFTGNVVVNFPGKTTFALTTFGIKNVNSEKFFGDSINVPAIGSGNSALQSTSLSTTLNNVLLIGSVTTKGNQIPTAGTGYNIIQSGRQGQLGFATEAGPLTTAVDSYLVSFSTTSTVDYVIIGDAIWGQLTNPSVNTDSSLPVTQGSTILQDGEASYFVSPAYSSASNIIGSLQLNLWTSASATDSLEVYVLATDSNYNILQSGFGKTYTGTVPTNMDLVNTALPAMNLNIPSGGHLVVVIINTEGGSAATFTIHWGVNELSGMSMPGLSDYILSITNIAATDYQATISLYSSIMENRLSDMSIYFYSPETTCLVVEDGSFIQTSSPSFTLAAGSSVYLAIDAVSSFGGQSIFMLLLEYGSGSGPFAVEFIEIIVN
ncbi:MAG: hypothetical protein IAX22_08665 [Candidatus Bathyarchaeota archaeon]|mgnify:CR=1 FL=1|nr:hypothetical protein [Thermoproteota archaeon]MDT8782695.1 hypothetical protein [Candidatus Bathyarchaeota archaeon]NLD67085.1 hypothetical protein [Thermoproteota archaeon]